MAINPKLLNDGERVVVSTRTHVKALFVPILVLLLVVFVTAFVLALVSRQVGEGGARTGLSIAVLVLGAGALVLWSLKPFLSWFFSSYTFTDRRLIQRTGIVAKEGRTIPLNRISGVDFEMGVVDRLLGCGTLVVSDASEQGRVELHDIPRVEQVQKEVASALHRLGSSEKARDDGT